MKRGARTKQIKKSTIADRTSRKFSSMFEKILWQGTTLSVKAEEKVSQIFGKMWRVCDAFEPWRFSLLPCMVEATVASANFEIK